MIKTTKSKAAAAVLTLAMVLSLTACGHEHQWYSSCTEPKTCSECGATEGEATGHTWTAATCTAPKTCTACGATEGRALAHTWAEATCTTPKTCTVCGLDWVGKDPLGHIMTEATYDAPATCTVCGETVGEALTPDFVAYNIPLAELGQTYDFILPCSDDENKTTVTHVTVTDYHVFRSDDAHPAKEGYEYRQAVFEVLYDDDNAWNYGAKGYGCPLESYYDVVAHDNSPVTETENSESRMINYNGQEQEYTWLYPETISGSWVDKTITDKVVFTVQVPAGYDGIVVGVYDYNTVEYADGLHIFDIYEDGKFVLFRMA